ncbi:MAG TPA: hypothetical protein D7I09_09490, partial [Candidatus Poseidoniales archaeon]
LEVPYPGALTVGGVGEVSTTMTVVNTGANEATFVLAASVHGGGNPLSITFDTNVVTLASGASTVVPIQIGLDGAPSDGQVFH